MWGVQAAVDVNFTKCLYALARLNWQRGREELDDGSISPSRHAAPMFGRLTVGYKHERFIIEAYSTFQAECGAADMPMEEKDKKEIYALDNNGNAYSPSWYTLNLRASFNVSKSLSLNTTLENIADKRYRPYSSGISAPGRNVTMSITYNL